jgi:hypothetical protein
MSLFPSSRDYLAGVNRFHSFEALHLSNIGPARQSATQRNPLGRPSRCVSVQRDLINLCQVCHPSDLSAILVFDCEMP